MASVKGYSLAASERVLDLAEAGASLAEIASELDIGFGTLLEWAREHQEFAAALLLADRQRRWLRQRRAGGQTADM